MKIAHISDIHFFSPSIHIKDLFTKKWMGKLNASFTRKDFFITKHLDLFLSSLVREEVNSLLITGDFTTTSDIKEFELAKEFIQEVEDAGITVFALPGNHDTYTKKAFNKRLFYKQLEIQDSPISCKEISNDWKLVLLDSTIINPPFMAQGVFTKEVEEELITLLKDSTNILVANHFPLEDSHKHHKLLRGKHLKKILLNHRGTILYFHGHTHKTSYHKEGQNLHIFNSSEVSIKDRFKYQIIELQNEEFSHKEVKYYEKQ